MASVVFVPPISPARTYCAMACVPFRDNQSFILRCVLCDLSLRHMRGPGCSCLLSDFVARFTRFNGKNSVNDTTITQNFEHMSLAEFVRLQNELSDEEEGSEADGVLTRGRAPPAPMSRASASRARSPGVRRYGRSRCRVAGTSPGSRGPSRSAPGAGRRSSRASPRPV
jgi:hypothetical protein